MMLGFRDNQFFCISAITRLSRKFIELEHHLYFIIETAGWHAPKSLRIDPQGASLKLKAKEMANLRGL